MIKCYVGTDWQDAEERRGYDGGYDIDAGDAEDAAYTAAKRGCSDNSPEWYRETLYVITVDEEGEERKFEVHGEQDWTWHWPTEVEG